ncbi:hypothetical protein N9C68_00505 [Gammaproteobacteria bacterium]|nr:hypothetical protein [Gammaproteobacteria bacterium]
MMKLTLTLQKGEQHLIYVSRSRKFPDAIKNYRVNVKKVEGDIATIIDLDDKDKEKTFYIYKVLEVLEIDSSETDVNERLNWHRDNFFETYKPLKSFKLSKGLPLMKKKCSASIAGDTLKITIGNYPADLTRDIHFFSFLCAALKDMEINDKNRFNLSDCKSWNDFAIAMFPVEFEEYENFFKDEFDADMKNHYLEQFKEDVDSYNEEINELKNDKDLTPAERKDEIDRSELKDELRMAKEKLAIVKKDLRGMVVDWFAGAFNRKHNTYYFRFLEDVYDVVNFKQIDGFELML